MRWPYDTRADPIHAWGATAAGIAIAGAFYAARALNPHTARSWGWPTNWMITAVVITAVGLILLVLPVRQSRCQDPEPSREDPASPTTLESKTLTDVIMDGNARLTVDTSAERFADATWFTDNAQVTVRHFPGRPDILADGVKSPHGQEGQRQAGKGAGGTETPDVGSTP